MKTVTINGVRYSVLQATCTLDACDRCDVRYNCRSGQCGFFTACTSVKFGYLKKVEDHNSQSQDKQEIKKEHEMLMTFIHNVEYKLEMADPYAAPSNTACQLCDVQKECRAGDTAYYNTCRQCGLRCYLKRVIPTLEEKWRYCGITGDQK